MDDDAERVLDEHPFYEQQRAQGEDLFVKHVERLCATGTWPMLKPYLRRALAIAEQNKIPEQLVRTRYAAGVCIICAREPCDHCGTKNPLWCDVCWKLIEENCPPGMVVSGVAWVMQHLTKNGERP